MRLYGVTSEHKEEEEIIPDSIQQQWGTDVICFTLGRYAWKDNDVFIAPMEIVSYGRGRSSAVFYLKDNKTGKKYQMFMSSFMDMISEVEICNGVINGDNHWEFCKKGQNYGLKFVKRGY